MRRDKPQDVLFCSQEHYINIYIYRPATPFSLSLHRKTTIYKYLEPFDDLLFWTTNHPRDVLFLSKQGRVTSAVFSLGHPLGEKTIDGPGTKMEVDNVTLDSGPVPPTLGNTNRSFTIHSLELI